MRLFRISMLAALGFVSAYASDFSGVYGIISKVVFEPNADHPQRVTVHGVFSVAANSYGNTYLPAQRGYLCLTVEGLTPAQQQNAIQEWMDLKSVEGTGEVVSFSSRQVGLAPIRVWKPEERSVPEKYRLGVGVAKVRGKTDYEPVQSVVELYKKPQS